MRLDSNPEVFRGHPQLRVVPHCSDFNDKIETQLRGPALVGPCCPHLNFLQGICVSPLFCSEGSEAKVALATLPLAAAGHEEPAREGERER